MNTVKIMCAGQPLSVKGRTDFKRSAVYGFDIKRNGRRVAWRQTLPEAMNVALQFVRRYG